KVISAASIVILVAACSESSGGGGGEDDRQTVAPEVARTGSDSRVSFRYDPDQPSGPVVWRRGPSGTFLLTQAFDEVTITGMPDGFNSYYVDRLSKPYHILRGLTPSGQGEIFLEPGSTTGMTDSTTVLSRLGETTLPDSGMVTYTGTYAGLYSVVGQPETAGHMFGRAQLELDFASNTLSGLIDQRANSGGQAATDITLELGAMADGSFSGTTTGGAFASGYSSAPGTYGGLIVGQNGEEAIGQATVYHNGATDYVETGGFIVGVCNPNC
ncbi:MAG: hypothetical protein AAFY14_11710, partial [Pseudomonadota bacterium]